MTELNDYMEVVMSERALFVFSSVILLLMIGFAETFLSTKYRQLQYQNKMLTQEINLNRLKKDKRKSELYKNWDVSNLLMEPALQNFKKALPNDITLVKFNNPIDNKSLKGDRLVRKE